MSIPHFDALSKKRALHFLEHPDEFTIQEKIDGSYFKIKLDEAFPWAQRKGPKIYYSYEDWGNEIWSSTFKTAHLLLTRFTDSIQMSAGTSTLEMEILQGDRPNTIQYNPKSIQLVVFSEVLETYNWAASHNFVRQTSLDGLTFVDEVCSLKWESISLPTINATERLDVEEAKNLANNLKASNQASTSESLRDIGTHLRTLLVPLTSAFGSLPPEGVVVKHQTGWMFKLVDREYFTQQNQRNYQFRSKLFKSAYGRANSLMDQFHASAASSSTKNAANESLALLVDIRDEYWQTQRQTVEPFINVRNLEALASIKKDLEDYRDGRKSL